MQVIYSVRILRDTLKVPLYSNIGPANEQHANYHTITVLQLSYISCCKNRVTVSGNELQTGGTVVPNGITVEEIKKTEKSL